MRTLQLVATVKDVITIVRWDGGSLGLTGWGAFWVLIFAVGR